MNVEQKLALDTFVVDDGRPHIVPHEHRMDAAMKQALTTACPAGLYTLAPDGGLAFEFAGCLECGSCRGSSAPVCRVRWTGGGPDSGCSSGTDNV